MILTGERAFALDLENHSLVMQLRVTRASDSKIKHRMTSVSAAAAEQDKDGTSGQDNTRKRSHNNRGNGNNDSDSKTKRPKFYKTDDDEARAGNCYTDSEPGIGGNSRSQSPSVIVLNDDD
jgi:hypothetical protein